MKVLFAMIVAWFLRMCWALDLADRVEAWAGIDYTDDDQYKPGGTA